MNTEKLFAEAKGEDNHDATLSFRLSQDDKDALLVVCEKHRLSLGKLMRGLVKELLENV